MNSNLIYIGAIHSNTALAHLFNAHRIGDQRRHLIGGGVGLNLDQNFGRFGAADAVAAHERAIEEVKMVGFIAVDLRRSQQVAWIATLAVDPEYRKTGIGSELLNVCEGIINLPVIRLSVRQSNQSAIELYRKHDYQQVDIWKSYYKGGDNALIFEKILKQPA